jgi:hypothetical protein
MSEWQLLDPNTLSSPQKREVRGVQINVLISPYDVPQGIRGSFDRDLNRFVIEFKYMDGEPTRKEHADKYLAAFVGKSSGRLYRIEVDVVSLKASAVELRLEVPKLLSNALADLAQSHHQRKDNYDLAQRVIQDPASRVLQSLDSFQSAAI